MKRATVSVETLVLPTYPDPAKEEMPLFAECRDHQRTTGRPYPNKATLAVDRTHREEKAYTAVRLENDWLEVIVLPEIGGKIFSARDKTTGYDFFYRQHVIKPGLIGAFGSWTSGGVEFNWPFHHRASAFLPCDYEIEECADGSAVCWLSEHEPTDRMKGMVGVALRPDASYLETRVRLCNRTESTKSFLWWENAAVPVNESYQIFFPKDVTYVSFHYLDSRISYPIAGNASYNGIDMRQARDISMHKNSRDATSYFACASKYDFFGGYDHGRACGVVHIADHHIAPGKKMFTWGYKQLAETWERTLTDSDGQYAELMAGAYTDNQPNFSWLEPYETKEFSQFWYPISRIGTPDFASLRGAIALREREIAIETTETFGAARVTVTADGETILSREVVLEAANPVTIPWTRPDARVQIAVSAGGKNLISYAEERPDNLKKPPVKDAMKPAAEIQSADELYMAGLHVWQYRAPAVMPDAYWLEGLRRDPQHAGCLLGMAGYCYRMARFEEAEDYARRAVERLTLFNARIPSGDAYYQLGLIHEAEGRLDEAYDYYRQAAWVGSSVSKAMTRAACLALSRGDAEAAADHARQALTHDTRNPLAPVVLVLAQRELGDEAAANAVIGAGLESDRFNMLLRFLSGLDRARFFAEMRAEPAQTVLDMAFDLLGMGQYALTEALLADFGAHCGHTVMTALTLGYVRHLQGRDAGDAFEIAADAPLGDTYPVRAGEINVLSYALDRGFKRAAFLLGCEYYDKRQYARATALFERALRDEPDNYMVYRSLAVAYYSHMNRRGEALPLMRRALAMSNSEQLLYETAVLMDQLGAAPEEKLDLLLPRLPAMRRDDLFVEAAKAYNQARRPEKAREVLMNHVFTACEGGEHAIADQYMFSFFQEGARLERAGDYEAALESYTQALTLPASLGAGIWNRTKYVPYRYRIAGCLDKLGRRAEAEEIWREILRIDIDFFSNMYLPELPYYQALAAEKIGLQQRAWNLMGEARRSWTRELKRTDSGFFRTTPFFISFVQSAAELREAQYDYLLGLVSLYEGDGERAAKLFEKSCRINADHLFCQYYRDALAGGDC